jgi:valyl-tRNA synthetase
MADEQKQADPPVAPTEETPEGAAILADITEKGKAVAELKKGGGSKEDIDAAVKALIAVKTSYKEVTGKDLPVAPKPEGKKKKKKGGDGGAAPAKEVVKKVILKPGEPGYEDQLPIDPETGEPYSSKKWKKIQKGGYKDKSQKKKQEWGAAGSGKKKAAAAKKEQEQEKEPEVEFVNTTPKGDMKDMSSEMLPAYKPKAVECAWQDWWEKSGYYVADAAAGQAADHDKKFVMMLPPPNVTGSLHLGHALTVAIEDCVTRWHRMMGHPTLWLPGTDHAGIATQSVVEKKLFKEQGITRMDLGREGFLDKVWDWKHKYGKHITSQLRFLGCSVDWTREVFTMDDKLSRGVTEAFCRFSEAGIIYRRTRLVNWSCRLKTAISDIEVDHVDLKGSTMMPAAGHDPEKKYEFGCITSFAYKVKGSETDEEIVVATTRLETMLGDVAVAVHPDDKRYEHLVGKELVHPFVPERKVVVITDAALVDMDFGTGAVKITPAHDPNDYECGKRHGLEEITILTETGAINVNGGEFKGMMRYDARVAMEKALEEKGLYRGKEDNPMVLGICQRSGDIIEPLLKPQWYVNCASMAARAVDVVRSGEMKIVPKFHEATWYRWLENIRDWCISRQLWWGHRIPAYFATQKGVESLPKDDPKAEKQWVIARTVEEARTQAAAVLGCAPEDVELEQDEDVLDTWFSSGLFPFSTLGWPDDTPDMKAFFPGHLLETGHDILFFWVARMVMMSLQLTDQIPFKTVYLHAMVRDKYGRKMSKSLGNVVDPLEVINGCELDVLFEKLKSGNLPEKEIIKAMEGQKQDFPDGIPECGADALRFGLLAYTSQGRDVNLDVARLVGYRNFCNKLWNVTRFILMPENLAADWAPPADMMERLVGGHATLGPREKFILSKLNKCVKVCNDSMKSFNFADVTTALHQFWLYSLCGTYLEAIKPAMRGDDADAKGIAQQVLFLCVDAGLRLMHPVCPFVTEELWQRLPGHGQNLEAKVPSIMMAAYPQEMDGWTDDSAETQFEYAQEVVGKMNAQRASYQLKPSERPEFFVCVDDEAIQATITTCLEDIKTLSRAGNVTVLLNEGAPKGCAVTVLDGHTKIGCQLTGLIDFTMEVTKAEKKLAPILNSIVQIEKRMALETYLEKTPEKVRLVDADKLAKQQKQRDDIQQTIAGYQEML